MLSPWVKMPQNSYMDSWSLQKLFILFVEWIFGDVLIHNFVSGSDIFQQREDLWDYYHDQLQISFFGIRFYCDLYRATKFLRKHASDLTVPLLSLACFKDKLVDPLLVENFLSKTNSKKVIQFFDQGKHCVLRSRNYNTAVDMADKWFEEKLEGCQVFDGYKKDPIFKYKYRRTTNVILVISLLLLYLKGLRTINNKKVLKNK